MLGMTLDGSGDLLDAGALELQTRAEDRAALTGGASEGLDVLPGPCEGLAERLELGVDPADHLQLGGRTRASQLAIDLVGERLGFGEEALRLGHVVLQGESLKATAPSLLAVAVVAGQPRALFGGDSTVAAVFGLLTGDFDGRVDTQDRGRDAKRRLLELVPGSIEGFGGRRQRTHARQRLADEAVLELPAGTLAEIVALSLEVADDLLGGRRVRSQLQEETHEILVAPEPEGLVGRALALVHGELGRGPSCPIEQGGHRSVVVLGEAAGRIGHRLEVGLARVERILLFVASRCKETVDEGHQSKHGRRTWSLEAREQAIRELGEVSGRELQRGMQDAGLEIGQALGGARPKRLALPLFEVGSVGDHEPVVQTRMTGDALVQGVAQGDQGRRTGIGHRVEAPLDGTPDLAFGVEPFPDVLTCGVEESQDFAEPVDLGHVAADGLQESEDLLLVFDAPQAGPASGLHGLVDVTPLNLGVQDGFFGDLCVLHRVIEHARVEIDALDGGDDHGVAIGGIALPEKMELEGFPRSVGVGVTKGVRLVGRGDGQIPLDEGLTPSRLVEQRQDDRVRDLVDRERVERRSAGEDQRSQAFAEILERRTRAEPHLLDDHVEHAQPEGAKILIRKRLGSVALARFDAMQRRGSNERAEATGQRLLPRVGGCIDDGHEGNLAVGELGLEPSHPVCTSGEIAARATNEVRRVEGADQRRVYGAGGGVPEERRVVIAEAGGQRCRTRVWRARTWVASSSRRMGGWTCSRASPRVRRRRAVSRHDS